GGRQTDELLLGVQTFVVEECARASVVGLAQRTDQERRHLAPGHVVVRAEPIVLRRVAPTGNTCRRQAIDVTLEDASVVVDELVPAAVVGVTQRTHQERRHLTTSHVVVRAEPIVLGRIAATSDPLGGQPLDIRLEHVTVCIGEIEWAGRIRRRLLRASTTTRGAGLLRRRAGTTRRILSTTAATGRRSPRNARITRITRVTRITRIARCLHV